MNREKVFPAHFRISDDKIHTLEEHLEGVKTKCGSFAAQVGFASTGKLLGLLHDIGKYSDEFCNYINEAFKREKEGLPALRSNIDHGKYGAILILHHYHNGDIYSRMLSEIIAMTVCYHHGGMEDFISENLDIKLFSRCNLSFECERVVVEDRVYNQICNRFYARVMSQEELDIMFYQAVEELKEYIEEQKKAGSISHFDIHLMIKLLYSCLVDADRYDTYLFTQNKHEKDALDNRYLWEEFSERLAVKEAEFQRIKTGSQLEETIRQLRHDIWLQCRDFSKEPTGIYTLTVPTGGGKTLSSLRFALDHAIRHGKKRIIYVLPFTSIIEQNADVVRSVLNAGDYLLEHHSSVVSETAYGSDDYEYRKLLTEQWTSPIIFTTMVQFLNTFFASGTRDIRRFHNLTDSIIIFDEIQALPIKCITLFNETVNFLSRLCRNTIILCSATQPNLDQVKHKIDIKQEIIKDINEKFDKSKRMEIIDSRYEKKLSVPELSEFIYLKKQENASVLTILNTKKTAESVFLEVKKQFTDESNILLYYLSTNLCANHRKEIIRDIKKALSDHKQVICVSTQLIEAGVDISFSCVIRHVAGLDSIAQASGRGNRHGEGDIKNTYIIELEDEALGSLKEIKLGEQCTGFVLNEYARDKKRFDCNLLSPKAIKQYYEYFYQEKDIEKKMAYPVSDYDSTIYNMLSRPNKRNAYRTANGNECPLIFEYQFKTAAGCFEVIDEATMSVLVPYNEGKSIINKLYSPEILPDMETIRSAQQYMVNISNKTHDELIKKGAIHIEERSGIKILDERFYDLELGVLTEGKEMGALLIGI